MVAILTSKSDEGGHGAYVLWFWNISLQNFQVSLVCSHTQTDHNTQANTFVSFTHKLCMLSSLNLKCWKIIFKTIFKLQRTSDIHNYLKQCNETLDFSHTYHSVLTSIISWLILSHSHTIHLSLLYY